MEIKNKSHNAFNSEWGHGEQTLKYAYKNEHVGEVKTYKWSKEQLDEYLKKYKK